MVDRYGTSVPVVEYIDRDIAHLNAQISALTAGLPAQGIDTASLVQREASFLDQLAAEQKQFDDLKAHAPAVPASMSGTNCGACLEAHSGL